MDFYELRPIERVKLDPSPSRARLCPNVNPNDSSYIMLSPDAMTTSVWRLDDPQAANEVYFKVGAPEQRVPAHRFETYIRLSYQTS